MRLLDRQPLFCVLKKLLDFRDKPFLFPNLHSVCFDRYLGRRLPFGDHLERTGAVIPFAQVASLNKVPDMQRDRGYARISQPVHYLAIARAIAMLMNKGLDKIE